MAVASHQTIALDRGHHAGPEGGKACVMELASMLAGERFSDRPRTACPVIAAFLRTYNDLVDHDRRQELYPYAAEVVGTRGGRRLERLRADLCLRWLRGRGPQLPARRLGSLGGWRRMWIAHVAAYAAARLPSTQALTLVDCMLAAQKPGGRRATGAPRRAGHGAVAPPGSPSASPTGAGGKEWSPPEAPSTM